MNSFWKNSLLLFIALRIGDVVNLATALYLVPKYASSNELGALLPITSYAVFFSTPLYAFAMTVMKEAAALHEQNKTGELKSLLSGVFVAMLAIIAIFAVMALLLTPLFADSMNIGDESSIFLMVCAAFLGCAAPVFLDAVQARKMFKAVGIIELSGSICRLLLMALVMPHKALCGYFAGQSVPPLSRILGSIASLHKLFPVKSKRYWNKTNTRMIALNYAGMLAYQLSSVAVNLVEQWAIRIWSTSADSAGYYMATRFSDILFYITFPLLTVMFPYTSSAAVRGKSTAPFVIHCSAVTLSAAGILSIVYLFAGESLIKLLPGGSAFTAWSDLMPLLAIVTAMVSCQVFHTNAEVSAGRYNFLWWFAPLNLCYMASFYLINASGAANIHTVIFMMTAMAFLRLVFSLIDIARRRKLQAA